MTDSFSENQHTYRCWLFADGMEVKESQFHKEKGQIKRKGIKEENVDKVLKFDGKLSRYELLRSKVKFFTEGVVIGSQSFIASQRQRYLEAKGADEGVVKEQLQRGRRKEDLASSSLVTWRW